MRLFFLMCSLILSASISSAESFSYSKNPVITFHFGDKVSQSSRDNIIEGVRRVEEFFRQATGDSYEGNINVVAYHDDRFFRKTVPSRYRYSTPCGGGYSHNGRRGNTYYVVICLSSWPFKSANEHGQLAERERELAIHEMTHVMQKHWMGHKAFSKNPHWLRESEANFLGHTLRSSESISAEEALSRIARSSNSEISLRRIHTMEDFADHRPYSYANTAQATHWRVENFGWDAIKAYWQAEGQGKAPNAAFKLAYGMSLNDFYKQFEYME